MGELDPGRVALLLLRHCRLDVLHCRVQRCLGCVQRGRNLDHHHNRCQTVGADQRRLACALLLGHKDRQHRRLVGIHLPGLKRESQPDVGGEAGICRDALYACTDRGA